MSIVKPTCLSTLIYIINRYFCEIDICNHMDGSMHIAQVFLILSLRNKEWHIYEILSTCDLFTSCSVLKAFHQFTCCSLKSGQCSCWMFAFHLSPVHLHLLDCTEWAVLSQEAGWLVRPSALHCSDQSSQGCQAHINHHRGSHLMYHHTNMSPCHNT